MRLSSSIPWPAKMLAKMVLSKIPISYRSWNRLGIFKHGAMLDPSYAYSKFMTHYGRVDFPRKGKDFVTLELGPGDSLHSALIAQTVGASQTYLVDVGCYALCPADCCQIMAKYLRQMEGDDRGLAGNPSSDERLSSAGATYLTHGLKSLADIPNGSVDFIWSEAVLEHIRLDEFDSLMRQLKRILRPDGVCSHHVDLKDHLGGYLNHLRFSQSTWESDLFHNSGFYTNRLRFSEMLEIFQTVGFSVDNVTVQRWPTIPFQRSSLDSRFSLMTDEELCVSGFDVILR